jgi:DNA-binding IclR family transcriptional regulator
MAQRHESGGRRVAGAEGERLVKSAYRVMQVFEFFSERRTPANATEIARSLNFPQSSTSMLLKSLTTLGYLEYRHESRKFQPTIRLSLLGGWVPDRLTIADRILAFLGRLQEFTGETVLLGTQHRHFVRCIFVLPGASPQSCDVPTGTLWPICTTAMGDALLSLKGEADIRGIVRRANAEETDPARRVAPGALFERLDRYRAQGFASGEERWEDRETSTVAMLLPPQEDGARLCVAVAAPAGGFRVGEAATALYMRELIGRLDAAPAAIARRAAAAGERRDLGFSRPELHLIHSRSSEAAE